MDYEIINFLEIQTNYTTFETKINKAIEDMNTNLSKYIKYGNTLYLWSAVNKDKNPFNYDAISLVTPTTHWKTEYYKRFPSGW